MYEVVKTVKGHDIYRAKNTIRHFYVDIKKTEKSKVCYEFTTIKAATQFINNNF